MKKFPRVMKRIMIFTLFATLFASLVVFGFGVKAANIDIKGVDIIYSNPGEDCSTQITISWHAKSRYSTLIYTLKSDPTYAFATSMLVTGIYDESSFFHYDVAKFYKCTVPLKDLDPDTEYIYKIRCDDYTSEQYTFRTAGASEFTFAYMSDIHAIPYDDLELGMTAVKKLKTVQTLLEKAEDVNDTRLSFIITTGDETWRGSQYSNWLEWSKTQFTSARKDYLWLSCPGNHEYYTQTTNSIWNYYPDKYSSNPSAIYDDPEYFYNTYFNSVKAVPKNGPEGIPSSYYTLYNNILFICIDSMQVGDYGKLNETRAWFERVMQKNEGKYQYIIVYQHYPWYDFVTGEDKYAYRWRDLFDKYGVDLALSGHMHGYLRTKTLYDGKVTTEEKKGTVYVVSPQIGDRPKVTSGDQNKNLIAYRESTKTWTDYSAISTITVTNEGLTYKLIDVDGKVRDTFTIEARRASTISESHKNSIIDSLTFSGTPDSIVCDFKSSYSLYVKNIKVEAGGKSGEVNPSEQKTGYVAAKGLANNTLYDAKVTITFIDDSTYTTSASVVTSGTFGLINNLKANVVNDKMNINWNVSDASLVDQYKIYINDELEGTSTTNSYEIDKSRVEFSTKYTLEAYKDNKLLFHKDFYYGVYGDVNLDGSINDNDVKKLIELIFAGYVFNSGAIKLLDNNNDGIVDIGDAFKILAYQNERVEHLVYNEYEVTFVGYSGNALARVKVLEGEDAVAPEAPTITGYTFVGWSVSYTNVNSNLIVRAIYEAN
ncbi:MAG: metallophosphoesterase [Bacilli bacterium]|nr:metallophosphoesterase [Bacilli bacterium]